MEPREATDEEKKELFDYLAKACMGKITRKNIESISEDSPIVVMDDYAIPENHFQGKVLLSYMPLPDANTTPHVYYWHNGKITRAVGIPTGRQ